MEQINKYNKGKIYFLKNDENNEIFYVGSTVLTLHRRLRLHINDSLNINKNDYNCKKAQYIRLMNINKLSIHHIEDFLCNTRDQLLFRERYHIEERKPICNIRNPILSIDERKEDDKLKSQRYSKTKINCKCGGYYSLLHKQRHFLCKKHINKIIEIYMLD